MELNIYFLVLQLLPKDSTIVRAFLCPIFPPHGAGVETQGLVHAEEVLYHPATLPVGLFLIDHVEEVTHLVSLCNMGRGGEKMKCGNHQCFSNRVMLFCNSKCLFLK